MILPISDWLLHARQLAPAGDLPAYLPFLPAVNPQAVAVAIASPEGRVQIWGESPPRIVLMSVMKPFLLLYCLSQWGEEIWERVGQEPSLESFNSLNQLQRDRGFPRNPMINSGAIALAGLLSDAFPEDCCDRFGHWLNQIGGGTWCLDRKILAGVESLPNIQNQAIANTLAEAGYLDDPEQALATYNHLCCLAGSLGDLAQLGKRLVQPPPLLVCHHCQIVQQTMATCGLYEESANFAENVGLPSKSGVSGLILSLLPHHNQAIAIYSPPLNSQGNSLAGLWLIQQIADALDPTSQASPQDKN